MDQAALEKLRIEALEDVEKHAKGERFDLFSQPPPLCIGDAGYKTTHHPRDATNNPVTQPRNIQTNPVKQSQLPSSYLDGKFLKAPKGKEADPYVDPTKLKMGLVTASGVSIAKIKQEGKDGDKKPFYPVIGKWNQYKGLEIDHKPFNRLGAPYKHIDEEEKKINKLQKDSTGRQIVPVKSRNIQAAPIHPGHYNATYGHTINRYPKWMEDKSYGQGAKDAFNESQKLHKIRERLMGGKHFRYTCFPKAVVNTDRSLYELPDEFKKPMAVASAKSIRESRSSSFDDRRPFKPSNPMKSGEGGYITKFIRLEPKEPPKQLVKHIKDPNVPDKKNFIPSRGYKSRPTPSITLHMSNIRSSLAK